MRICIECSHFKFIEGSEGYSEYTPGYSATIFCRKNVWEVSCLNDISEAEYRKSITTAEDCQEFRQREGIINEHI